MLCGQETKTPHIMLISLIIVGLEIGSNFIVNPLKIAWTHHGDYFKVVMDNHFRIQELKREHDQSHVVLRGRTFPMKILTFSHRKTTLSANLLLSWSSSLLLLLRRTSITMASTVSHGITSRSISTNSTCSPSGSSSPGL